MKRAFFSMVAFMTLFAIAGMAEEKPNEVNFQGTGFFTKDTTGRNFEQKSTQSGGLLIGYRYHLNSWFSLETNYGFARNTQKYLVSSTSSRIQSDVHQATIDAAFNLPFAIGRVSPYAIGGAGALVFSPTNNKNGSVSGASRDARGTLLYGVGVKYPVMRNISLVAEYRGLVYKNADFGLKNLYHNSWTHTAQPSAGFTYRF